MSDIVPQKACSVCKQFFPISSDFWHKHKKSRDGFSGTCKECAKKRSQQWTKDNPERSRESRAAYYQDHQEDLRAYARNIYWADPVKARARRAEYYQNNRESCDATNRLWILSHPERAKEIKRDYAKRHPERRLRSSRLWHERNRARERQMSKEYRKRNPDKTKAYYHSRRALEKSAEGTFTAEDIRIAYRAQRGKCWHCFANVGDQFHADHLISLKNGGTNWPNNIVISCPDCNLKKGSKMCYQWNRRLF